MNNINNEGKKELIKMISTIVSIFTFVVSGIGFSMGHTLEGIYWILVSIYIRIDLYYFLNN